MLAKKKYGKNENEKSNWIGREQKREQRKSNT